MTSILQRLLTRKPATGARESVPLALADGREVDVLRVRDPRARRLRLTVSERGVRLTVPRAASARLVEAFLAEHRDWLAAQLAKRPATTTTPFSRGSDAHLPLRGESLPLHWREGRYARARLGEHGIELSLPDGAGDARARAALREFYLAEARADVGRWLPAYLPSLPRAPRRITLRPLSSLWGSLSASAALSLDLSLVLGRPGAFEYVLVHELCHLLQANHSPRFWREVESRWPDWRGQRDYLHGEGLALKSELRRLIAP